MRLHHSRLRPEIRLWIALEDVRIVLFLALLPVKPALVQAGHRVAPFFSLFEGASLGHSVRVVLLFKRDFLNLKLQVDRLLNDVIDLVLKFSLRLIVLPSLLK